MRLIDADALMKEFAKFVAPSNNSDFADEPTWNDAVSLLGSAPTIEPKKGKWVEDEYWDYKCSACGKGIDDEIYLFMPYCPNCGARMVSE